MEKQLETGYSITYHQQEEISLLLSNRNAHPCHGRLDSLGEKESSGVT